MNTYKTTSSSNYKKPYKHPYSSKSILIIETTGCLAIPLTFFPSAYKIESALTVNEARIILQEHSVQLIAFNVSCPEGLMFEVIHMINQTVKDKIIPLLLVIDLSIPLTVIPGTSWGGRLGILHSLSTRAEFLTTMQRLFEDL